MKIVRALIFVIVMVFAMSCYSQKEEPVKNIIFLIGDGMGLTQMTSALVAQDYDPL